jgi:hypothetical protein
MKKSGPRWSVSGTWKSVYIYVEYLTLVSIEYILNCVLPSLTSTAGWIPHVLLAYVIPWINEASLALYIARAVPCSARLLKSVGSCSVLSSSSLWLKRRKLSLSRSRVSLRLHLCRDWGVIDCSYALVYWRPLPHSPLQLCSYWGYGVS